MSARLTSEPRTQGPSACDALHLKVGDDPTTRLVADKVIELAQRGIRDPDMLRKMTLKELDLSDESARDN